MGAWGIKTFENDDACDWIYELEKTSDLALLESTLETSRDKYLEGPDGCAILAAVEVILALQGNSREDLPEDAAKWVSAHQSLHAAALNTAAVAALDKVVSNDSELNELWQETDDYQNWKNDVLDIKTAIQNF